MLLRDDLPQQALQLSAQILIVPDLLTPEVTRLSDRVTAEDRFCLLQAPDKSHLGSILVRAPSIVEQVHGLLVGKPQVVSRSPGAT